MKHLDDMVMFAAVANAGSFTKAAQSLGAPRSTVSRRISEIEKRLGVRLLERSTRSLRLTTARQTYLSYCEQIVIIADQADVSISALRSTVSAKLKISASLDIGHGLITPHISEFIESYPNVKLDLVYTNKQVDLIGEGFDLAIRMGNLEDSSLIATAVGKTSLKLFASQEYLSKHDYPETTDELTNHKLLILGDAMPKSIVTLVNDDTKVELKVDSAITCK